MQKHFQTKLFSLILGITFLLIPEFANAGIISLPRYTGEFAYRSNSGGRDKTCSSSYQYTCSGTGYAGGIGTSCNDLYTSCSCSTNYKWSGGSCVLKSCSDYGYSASKDNTKSCEEKTPRSGLTCYVCTGCDSSTYKYACSGGLNAAEQDTANKCGTNYSECSCVEHASWNSTSGKCECGSDYKAGTTSCTLKTCEDYGYSATEDTTKDCTKQTPRSGLACWNCSDCTGTLYDCSSMANASGADTSSTSCGGKYAKCKCKDLYVWDNGVCKLGCTRNSCSTTTYPLTAQNAANASNYEKCTPSCSDESPRYKVSSCASGYNVNSNGSGCDKNEAATCAQYNSGSVWKWYCCEEGKDYLAGITFASSDVQSSRMRPQTFNSTYASVCPLGYRLPTPCELGYAKYILGISALNNKLSLEGKMPLKTSDNYSSQGVWYYTSGVDPNYPSRHIATATDKSGEASPSGNTSAYVDVYGSYIRCVSSEPDNEPKQTCEQMVTQAGGIFVTSANASDIRGLVTKDLYLKENVTFSNNIELAKVNIYSAYDKFNECKNDSTIQQDPKLTFDGILTVADGGDSFIHPQTFISELRSGGLTFYNDAEIHYVTLQGSRAGLYFNNDTSKSSTNIEIHSIDMDASFYQDFDLILRYEAKNVNVNIADFWCETWNSDCWRKCIVNIDGDYLSSGSFSFSPGVVTNNDSCDSPEAIEVSIGNRYQVCTADEIYNGSCSISSPQISIPYWNF